MTIRGLRNRLRMIKDGKWRHVCYELKCRAHGLDLHMESVEALGLAHDRCNWCSDSGGPDLEKVLDSVGIGPHQRALDIGCGKGGAMITLARYPFTRVDGVEISPKVAAIANANLAKMRLAGRCRVWCSDAAAFTDLGPYELIYMYNPFPRLVMDGVLVNLARSLAARPRPLTLIYKNPVHHEIVRSTGFELLREFRHSENPFFVYRSVAAAIRIP